MADLDSLSFKGTSPEECEGFISTIRRQALAQGKHHDNDWIAFLASSYFVGDALYWYEQLDEDVQKDWSRLRPALLAKFGKGGLTSPTTSGASSIPTSAPFTTIPTPAAAPPETVSPPPSVRKGYLKVLSSDGLCAYLTRQTGGSGLYTMRSENISNALFISFPVSSTREAFEIRIINTSQLPQSNDRLGITWPHLPGNKWMDDMDYFACCCSFSSATSERGWATEQKVWKISKEGELSVEYPKPDGEIERLHYGAPFVSRPRDYNRRSTTDDRQPTTDNQRPTTNDRRSALPLRAAA